MENSKQPTLIPPLAEKLKTAMVQHLLSNHEPDVPFLYAFGRNWTRAEIAEEINSETATGIRQMVAMLNLAIDLMARKKSFPKPGPKPQQHESIDH